MIIQEKKENIKFPVNQVILIKFKVSLDLYLAQSEREVQLGARGYMRKYNTGLLDFGN